VLGENSVNQIYSHSSAHIEEHFNLNGRPYGFTITDLRLVLKFVEQTRFWFWRKVVASWANLNSMRVFSVGGAVEVVIYLGAGGLELAACLSV